MSQSGALDSLNCPNCGATLEFRGRQKTTRCKYCGSVIARPDETLPPQSQPVAVSYPTTSARSGGRFAVILVLFILLVTLIPIGIALTNINQAGRIMKSILSGELDVALTTVPILDKRIRVGESGAFIPSLSDAPPDIIVLTTQYALNGDEQEQRLVALSSQEPRMLWQSPPLNKNTYRTPILANEDFVYVLEGARLIAFHRADGSSAWEVPLPDEVSLYVCQDCIHLLGERLFTLTDDGTLSAFDANTGEALWDYRAVQDSPRGLYILGDRLAFMDRDENNDGLMRLFDPVSGEMQTVQPTCFYNDSYTEYIDWTTPLYLSPDHKSFYLVFGSPKPCAQRWDAQTLSQLWSTDMPSGIFYDSPILVTEETLYLGNDNQLLAFNTGTGELQPLLTNDDYEFVPLTLVDDSLLVRAMRQRGSQRFEIWSVNKNAVDEVNWTFDLGQNPPFDPPNANTSIIDEDEPVWTWHVAPEGLMIIRFKRAEDDVSHALLLETLNRQTGTSSGSEEIQLGISTIILSTPEFVVWQQDTMWMSIEGQVLGFDATAGEIVYRWP